MLELLHKGGMDGDVDFLREALRVLVEGIMDAEVSSRIGAEYGERSPERVNGYRSRAWDTRVGTMKLHIPAQRGELLPEPAGATASQRASSAGCDPAGLSWKAPRRHFCSLQARCRAQEIEWAVGFPLDALTAGSSTSQRGQRFSG